jgi:hypothetical protein
MSTFNTVIRVTVNEGQRNEQKLNQRQLWVILSRYFRLSEESLMYLRLFTLLVFILPSALAVSGQNPVVPIVVRRSRSMREGLPDRSW